MLDLYNMLERINDLEYNQAISDLDQEAAEGENATELRGVFTDGFIGVTKSDVTHPSWDASIDLDNRELTLPFSTVVTGLVIDTNSDFKAGQFGRLATNPYSEILLMTQPLVSDSIRVNSYNAFPKSPSLKLYPEVDNWIEESNVTIQGGVKTGSITLRRWWYHKNESWAQAEKALWQSYGYADGGESLNWADGTYTAQLSSIESIITTAITYMRQRSVNITLQNMEPNVDNIVATFNGSPVELSPTKAIYQGGTTGTLKADSTGNAYGYFNVPANTLCGTVEVKAYAANTPTLTGSATYTSVGNKRVTTKKVWTQKVTIRATDPLAQSFQFDQDQFVTGVGLFFLDKDLNEPITVQVRNMVNGYPGTTVYAEKVVPATAIRTSTTAAQETKVVFDNPVYCNANEQYCFTVLSNSDIDSVWYAETNKIDITSRAQISKNPYLNGTMFSSSNALTWTAHQSADLKFNLYGAKFETAGQVVFQPVTANDFDRIMIMSDESIPTGCSVNWQYAINDGEWMPIETYDDRELSELADVVKIRCILSGSTTTSPTIALDSLILTGFSNSATGTYISKNVNIPSGFNRIKVVLDVYLPTGTNAVAYYATDTAGNTWYPLTNTDTTQKSALFKTLTFENELTTRANNYRVKIDMSTVNKINRPHIQNLRNILKTV